MWIVSLNRQCRDVTPVRSSAVVISGFFMNHVQIRPEECQ